MTAHQTQLSITCVNFPSEKEVVSPLLTSYLRRRFNNHSNGRNQLAMPTGKQQIRQHSTDDIPLVLDVKLMQSTCAFKGRIYF